jgi:hypothetical protein
MTRATNKPAFTTYDAITALIVAAFIVIATAPAWLLAISAMP